ncbi:hypothetical protein Csa_023726, partial [Cucumis sativus]
PKNAPRQSIRRARVKQSGHQNGWVWTRWVARREVGCARRWDGPDVCCSGRVDASGRG